MKYQVTLAIITLLIAVDASAQIYRCEADGVVAFSDRPCGPDSAPHSSGDGVSFIAPDENLPALAEAARVFIRERRERLARRARAEQQTPTPRQTAPEKAQTVYVPWPVSRHRTDKGRLKRPDGPPPNIADNDRYSPLSGPMLGTRRDGWRYEPSIRRRDEGRRK
ncbi:DUF4124 domain-containing protein [Wenzhouxiangella sp. EGI_FJ10409]|uniref:DUF4124 domain-containing protein n=1 Tax=Wenzhouxiangella sp. EGI_FJ10409 TaxID=3243767 RepID=UPI0035DC35EE